MGEHLLCTQRVMGSNPFTSTRRRKVLSGKFRKILVEVIQERPGNMINVQAL